MANLFQEISFEWFKQKSNAIYNQCFKTHLEVNICSTLVEGYTIQQINCSTIKIIQNTSVSKGHTCGSRYHQLLKELTLFLWGEGVIWGSWYNQPPNLIKDMWYLYTTDMAQLPNTEKC